MSIIIIIIIIIRRKGIMVNKKIKRYCTFIGLTVACFFLLLCFACISLSSFRTLLDSCSVDRG